MTAPAQEPDPKPVGDGELRAAARSLVDATRLAALAFERPDIGEHLATALGRIDRSSSIVAVVGDFKQGKSALVNALVGATAVNVDDVESTEALTIVSYGREGPAASDEPSAAVRVELLAPWLQSGLSIVDAPASGGLSPKTGALLRASLSAVDGVVYAKDASRPMDAPTMRLLMDAAELCPAVIVALTKIDIFGEWRRIAEIDRRSIADAGLEIPIAPVSSELFANASTAHDSELERQSGIPALRAVIDAAVTDPSRLEAAGRGIDESADALGELIGATRAAVSALEDPSTLADRLASLEEARAKLGHLRGPGTRWSQVLSDTLSDATSDADHRYRAQVRDIYRELDERVEKIDPIKDWPALSEWLQQSATEAVERVIRDLDSGAAQAEQAAREVLRDQDSAEVDLQPAELVLPEVGARAPASHAGGRAGGLGKGAGLVLSGVKGGQSGFFSLSFVASLAGVTLSGVATAGIGLVFAGRQIVEERRRQLQARRQQARTTARRYLEDVEFVATKHVRDRSRDLQRTLREHFLDRFAALQASTAEQIGTIEQVLGEDEERRNQRLAKLRTRMTDLERLKVTVDDLGGRL